MKLCDRCKVPDCPLGYLTAGCASAREKWCPEVQPNNAEVITNMDIDELANFLASWAQRHRAWMCDGPGEVRSWLTEKYKNIHRDEVEAPEILFRGKRIDNGEWVYGTAAKFLDMKSRKYTAIIPVEDGINWMAELRPVDPVTVGRYTGLTDKTGQKIFEWDIIKTEIPVIQKWIVEYIDGAFCGLWLPEIRLRGLAELVNGSAEVIGNTNDNPELLENEVDHR